MLNGGNKTDVKTYRCEDFIMCLADGRYFHRDASVLTSERYQLAIVSRHPEVSQKEHALFNKIYLPRPKMFRGTGLLLSTPDDDNYYHCLFQIAPKLWQIQKEGYDIRQIDRFFLGLSNSGFQNEIISKLGIPKEKIVNLKQQGYIQVQQLLVTPPYRRPEPWICKKLRETFLTNESQEHKTAKRLYISRNKASYRKILNETELLKVLEKYDFQMVQTEGMSIQEQANLYNNAEIVMAVHGAALSNIVFCRPHTKVIELRQKLHGMLLGTVFEHLSSTCDLEHHTYLCHGIQNSFGPRPKFWDLQVDTDDIEKILCSTLTKNTLLT
ncbi:MAG: glycosyltransferase family 61 protein [Anditalea sp.]